ncbi:MAG: CAP domain-containing protein, partial [Firmicutes bacterium]|nr:CAP domain-containing protein [Bacillota bacterium]
MFKILSILFVLCFVPQVVQATTINSVTVLEVDGANASVFRAGGQRANPTVNMNLSNNSAVETGLQTTVTLNIGENSTLKLAAESRVTINTTGNALTFTVNNGNAWLIVSENEQNLQLNVGGINLTAHESIFAIGHGSDYVYVAMLLGESEIAETMIEEGQIFILRNNQTGLSDINLADLNQFTLNEISNNSENLLENSTFVTQTVLSQVRNLITAEPPQQSATFARRSWREAQDRWRAAQITRRADDSRIRQERNANLPDVVFVPNNPPVVTTPPILPTPFPPVVIPTPQPTQPPVVIPTPQPTQPPVATPTPTEPPTATPTPTQPPTATPTPTEPPTATPQPTPTPIPEQLLIEQGILEEINRIRAEHGLGSLTMAEPLVLAARDHALDSVTNNILGHTGSDGSNVRERVLRHGWPGWEVQLSETL